MKQAMRGAAQSLVRAAILSILAVSGCGTVCSDAIEVCGFDESAEPEDCSGATECASLCIVDWDACDVNDPESPEAQCIAACLAAAEEP